MRILLLAYEFPPSPSPQSLRWTYLVRELAAAGHEVHVLAPDIAGFGPGGLPAVPPSVRVHRTYAGHVMGLAARSARRRTVDATAADTDAAAGTASPARTAAAADLAAPGGIAAPERFPAACDAASVAKSPSCDSDDTPLAAAGGLPPDLNWKGKVWHAGLNWKGRIYEQVKRLKSLTTFPDVRGEWRPWAEARLLELLDDVRPDVVVSSHEPATTLELGLIAKKRGIAWVADIGDPVLAPYTPWRWRARSHRLERQVCRSADRVIVTTPTAAALFTQRHGLPPERCVVINQGFDDRRPAAAAPAGGERLELLYTGSFYAFRRPDALLAAVIATPGARLSVGTANAPRVLLDAAEAHPDKVRVLGFLPHDASVRLQRQAHVLVNISNDSPAQVPGKIYEYFGAGRPILHLCGDQPDAAGTLLERLGRGVRVRNDADAIAQALAGIGAAVADGSISTRFDLSREPVAMHGWSALAARVEQTLAAAIAAAAPTSAARGLAPSSAPRIEHGE